MNKNKIMEAGSDVLKQVAKESKGFALKEKVAEVISRNKETIALESLKVSPLELCSLLGQPNSASECINLSNVSGSLENCTGILLDGVKEQTKNVFTNSKAKIASLGGVLFSPVNLGLVGMVFTVGAVVHFGPKLKNFFQRKLEQRKDKRILETFNLTSSELDQVFTQAKGADKGLHYFLHASLEELSLPDKKLTKLDSKIERVAKYFFSEYKKEFVKKIAEITDPDLQKNLNWVKYCVLKDMCHEHNKTAIFSANYSYSLTQAKEFALKRCFEEEKKDTLLVEKNQDVVVSLKNSPLKPEKMSFYFVPSMEQNIASNLETIAQLEQKLEKIILSLQTFGEKATSERNSLDQEFLTDPKRILLEKQFDAIVDALDAEFKKDSDSAETKAKKEFLNQEFVKLLNLKGGFSSDDDDDSNDDSNEEQDDKKNEEPGIPFDVVFGMLDETLASDLRTSPSSTEMDWRLEIIKKLTKEFQALLIPKPLTFKPLDLTLAASVLEEQNFLSEKRDTMMEKLKNLVKPSTFEALQKSQREEEKEAFQKLKTDFMLFDFQFRGDKNASIRLSKKSFDKKVGPLIVAFINGLTEWAKEEHQKQVLQLARYSETADDTLLKFLEDRAARLKESIVKLENAAEFVSGILLNKNGDPFYIGTITSQDKKS